jgi:regulator of protease activity HflC (stomatin/prohibitin superfamily)
VRNPGLHYNQREDRPVEPLFALLLTVLIVFFAGIRIVRPTHRGLVERLGKYRRFAMPGFHWIIPIIDRMFQVNITEQMVDAAPQEIITNDNLNARVDAQIYFKVREDEDSVKRSQYAVNDYALQIVNLTRTTLRNIVGTLTLKSANSERDRINTELRKTLQGESQHWGIEIARAELKEIEPPPDVQETMNKVVKAENEAENRSCVFRTSAIHGGRRSRPWTSPPPPRPRPTASAAPRSRRPRASSRRASCRPRARRWPLSW